MHYRIRCHSLYLVRALADSFAGSRDKAEFDGIQRAHSVALHYSRILRGC